mmetsp:Transcript_16671/g.39590  ORF Transcript_16671/g.39590 Transcript_16671/m.39590 type:complete len:246 (-) Transcript_16671:516-1253(-)
MPGGTMAGRSLLTGWTTASAPRSSLTPFRRTDYSPSRCPSSWVSMPPGAARAAAWAEAARAATEKAAPASRRGPRVRSLTSGCGRSPWSPCSHSSPRSNGSSVWRCPRNSRLRRLPLCRCSPCSKPSTRRGACGTGGQSRSRSTLRTWRKSRCWSARSALTPSTSILPRCRSRSTRRATPWRVTPMTQHSPGAHPATQTTCVTGASSRSRGRGCLAPSAARGRGLARVMACCSRQRWFRTRCCTL